VLPALVFLFFVATAYATVTWSVIDETAVSSQPGESTPVRVHFDTDVRFGGEFIKLATENGWRSHSSPTHYTIVDGTNRFTRKAKMMVGRRQSALFDSDAIYVPRRSGVTIDIYPIGAAGQGKFDVVVYDLYGNKLGVIDPFYYNDWNARIPVVIGSNVDEPLYNVTVPFDLPYTTGMNPDYSDIRVTEIVDGVETPIKFYQFKNFYAVNTTRLWVRLLELPALNSTTIFVYYDNPNATDVGTLEAFDTAIVNCTMYNELGNFTEVSDQPITQSCVEGDYSYAGNSTYTLQYRLDTSNKYELTEMWKTSPPVRHTVYIEPLFYGAYSVGGGWWSTTYREVYVDYGDDSDIAHTGGYWWKFSATGEIAEIRLTHNQDASSSATYGASAMNYYRSALLNDSIKVDYETDGGNADEYEYSSGEASYDNITNEGLTTYTYMQFGNLLVYKTIDNEPNIVIGATEFNTRMSVEAVLRYTGTIYRWTVDYSDIYGVSILGATVTADITYPNGTMQSLNFTYNPTTGLYEAYFQTDTIGTYFVEFRADRDDDDYIAGYDTRTFEVVEPSGDSQIVVHDTGQYTNFTCLDDYTMRQTLYGEICQFDSTECVDYSVDKDVHCDYGCDAEVGCLSNPVLPGIKSSADIDWFTWLLLIAMIVSMAIMVVSENLGLVGAAGSFLFGYLVFALMPTPLNYLGLAGLLGSLFYMFRRSLQ